jgi:hypothetical protein
MSGELTSISPPPTLKVRAILTGSASIQQ